MGLFFSGLVADFLRVIRLEKRRQAMLDMPKMIQLWKQVCYSMISSGLQSVANI